MPLFGRKKAPAAAPDAAPAPDAPSPAPDAAAPAEAAASVTPDWTLGCSVKLQTTLQEVRVCVCGRVFGWVEKGGRRHARSHSSHCGLSDPPSTPTPHPQDPVEGAVFAYDPTTRVVVLASPGSAPFNARLRLLNPATITAVLSASPPPPGGATSGPTSLPLPPLDPAKCRDRLERATVAATAAAAKRGVGVSARAQAVFDALDRTLPCAWDGEAVVVLGEVRVPPPYAVDGGVTSNPADTKTLDRVAMVLAAEAERLPAHVPVKGG